MNWTLRLPLSAALVVLGLMVARPALAQAPAPISFEVATVKQNKSKDAHEGTRLLPGGRIEVTSLPLRWLVRIAYGSQTIQTIDQIVGGPSWAMSDRFDIVAKADGDPGFDADSGQPLRLIAMLRQLLEDRFQVKVHTEMREVQMYALVLAAREGKSGSRLKESHADCYTPTNRPPPGTPPDPARLCGIRGPVGDVTVTGVSMGQAAQTLAGYPSVGRPVVDHTGLSGRYDWRLQWTPMFVNGATADAPPVANPAADSGPNLFTALTEQVGLKLQPEKGQVEFIVIDHAERPIED